MNTNNIFSKYIRLMEKRTPPRGRSQIFVTEWLIRSGTSAFVSGAFLCSLSDLHNPRQHRPRTTSPAGEDVGVKWLDVMTLTGAYIVGTKQIISNTQTVDAPIHTSVGSKAAALNVQLKERGEASWWISSRCDCVNLQVRQQKIHQNSLWSNSWDPRLQRQV